MGENYQLESQGIWEVLRGRYIEWAGRKNEIGNDITLFQLKIYLRKKSCSHGTTQDGAKKDKKLKESA